MQQLDRLYDARDDVDRAAQVFEQAARPRRDRYEGTDESGTVTVRCAPEGVVTDVRVATGWRGRLAPGDLGAAVRRAVEAAALGRLEDWGANLRDAQDAPSPRVRPTPGLYDTLAGRLEDRVRRAKSPAEVAAVQSALVDVMDELIAGIDEVTADVDAALRATVRGQSGRDRHVVVELGLTGDLVDVTYDEAWLDRAHPANIGRETLAAVDDARRALAGRSVADVVAGSRLTRLRAELDDPDAVAQRLGL